MNLRTLALAALMWPTLAYAQFFTPNYTEHSRMLIKSFEDVAKARELSPREARMAEEVASG